MEQPRRCLGNAPETRHQHRQRVRRGKVDEHFKHRVLSLGIQRRDAQHHRRRNQHRYHLRGQQKRPLQSGLSAVPQLMQESQQAFHTIPLTINKKTRSFTPGPPAYVPAELRQN